MNVWTEHNIHTTYICMYVCIYIYVYVRMSPVLENASGEPYWCAPISGAVIRYMYAVEPLNYELS
jgi:hypothetical protein